MFALSTYEFLQECHIVFVVFLFFGHASEFVEHVHIGGSSLAVFELLCGVPHDSNRWNLARKSVPRS